MSNITHTVPPLYRQRTFSEKLSDTTDFVTANWRPMLRYLAMFLLPLCLVQALNVNQFMAAIVADKEGGLPDSELVGFALNYFSLIVFSLIGSVLMCSVVYALMRIYHGMSPVEGAADGSQSLRSLTWQQLRPVFKSMIRPSLKSLGACILMGIAIVLAVVLIIVVSALWAGPLKDFGFILYLLVVLFVLVFAVVAYSVVVLILPVYAFEDIGFFAGIAKAVRYGCRTCGGCLAVLFVVSLLTGVVTGVMGMPFVLLLMIKVIFLEDNTSRLAFAATPWYAFLQYIVAIIYIFANYIGYSLLFVAMAYQYGHAKEKVDGVGVEEFENASF